MMSIYQVIHWILIEIRENTQNPPLCHSDEIPTIIDRSWVQQNCSNVGWNRFPVKRRVRVLAGLTRQLRASSRRTIGLTWFFIDFHDFSLILETFFGRKPCIFGQVLVENHGFSRNASTLRSCISELRKPFRMSRHVFNIRIARSDDLAGPYSMGIAARGSKFAKRSEFFQDFPDPEDGPA